MKRIITTAAAAGLLAGVLIFPGSARTEDKAEVRPGAHGERAGAMESFKERMREKFGISEEQEAKLKAARRAKRDASEASRAEMKAAFRKLGDQLEDKAPEKELSATLDKLSSLRKARRAEEDKFEAAMSSILTPTQRAKMAVAMKGGKGRWHRGKKGGKHGYGEHD